jgi:hypothetical protein
VFHPRQLDETLVHFEAAVAKAVSALPQEGVEVALAAAEAEHGAAREVSGNLAEGAEAPALAVGKQYIESSATVAFYFKWLSWYCFFRQGRRKWWMKANGKF